MSNKKTETSTTKQLQEAFLGKFSSQVQESDLANLMFFSELTNLERRDMLPKLSVAEFKTGETIIDAEDENTDVFFLLDGVSEISMETPSGQRLYFQTVHEGEYFGEFSAIDGDPRSAVVKAQSPCRLLRMHRDTFLSIMLTHPKLALRLMERLVAMIRNGNQKIFDMATLTVIERLYNELKSLGEPVGDRMVLVRNPPSQNRLAANLGTARETVSRSLNKLITDQIITRGDKGIYLRLDSERKIR